MAQVRDKSGRVTTVSGTTADKLVQAGTHSYVKTGINTPGKSGTLPPREAGPSIWNRFLNSVGFSGLTNTFSGDATFRRNAQFAGPDSIGWEPNLNVPWSHDFSFTAEEQAAMDKYIDAGFGEANAPTYDENGVMTYGGFAAWWAIGDDGQKLKVEQGDWNIEHDGQAKEWSDDMIAWVSQEYHDAAGSSYETGQSAQDAHNEQFGDQPGGGSGSGRGGGGPVYIAPMREVIEDTVKSMLTTLTGDPTDALVEEYSDLFAAAHKERWDIAMAGGEDIDPNQVVLEAIRAQEDYLSIHALRPESSSETRWVPDQVARQSQLGVPAGDADERGIWMAQMGVNLNDVDTGAAQMAKGRKDITLFNKIDKAAQQIVGQL